MSRANRHGKAASRRDKRGARRARAPAERRPNRQSRGLRIFAMAVVPVSAALAISTVFTLPTCIGRTGGGASTAPSEPALPLFDSMPITAGLPPPTIETRVPVNAIDRFSGNPILASSPTVAYKGYVIAFCCGKSAGYTGGWDHLSEAEKDTYVRGFLK